MYLLFHDEAGTPGDRDFVLGGVAVHASRWHQLRERWIAVAGAHGRPVRAEVKWFNLKRSGQLASQLADALVESGVTSFVVVLRTEEGRAAAESLFASPQDVYATALMFIAERFQRFLAHRQDYGAIIIDERQGAQDERLRRFFRRLVDNGTPYARLERILDPVLLSPGHHTIGIQAADLVPGSMLAVGRADGVGSRRSELRSRAGCTSGCSLRSRGIPTPARSKGWVSSGFRTTAPAPRGTASCSSYALRARSNEREVGRRISDGQRDRRAAEAGPADLAGAVMA